MLVLALLLLTISTINCSEEGLTKQQLQHIDTKGQEALFTKQFEQAKSKGCFSAFFKDLFNVRTSTSATRYNYVRCLRTMHDVYPEEHYKSHTEFLLRKKDTPESMEYYTPWQFPTGCRRNKQTGTVVCYRMEPGEDIQFTGSGEGSPSTINLPVDNFDSMAIVYALQRNAGIRE